MRQPTISCAGNSLALAALLLVAVCLPAPFCQETEDTATPLTVAGYRLSGSVSTGYRLVEIDHGQNDLYREVIDLDEGVRLFDFMLRGNRTAEESKLVDRFSLDATHIGDSFPRIHLTVAKDDAYEFRMTLRQNEFFVNRTDDVFSDNHNVDEERRYGDFSLALFPTDFLKLRLFYRRMEKDGTNAVPRRIESNVFVLRKSPDETTNEFGAAADLSTPLVDVHLEQSYRRFDDDTSLTLPSAGRRGLRMDSPFAAMRLNTFDENRDRKVETWVTRLRLHSSLTERWDLTGGYVFAHTRGTSQIRLTEGGVGGAGSAGPNETFDAVVTGTGDNDSDVHVVELGSSYAVLQNLIWHLDYRFHHVDQDNQGRQQTRRTGSLTGTVTLLDTGSQDIETNAHTLSTVFEFLPIPTLTLRVGYRYQLRDVAVDQRLDGLQLPDNPLAAAPQLDRTTQSHGVIFSADWQYRDLVHASVKFDGDYFDDPYTRISPTRENRVRARVRVTPLEWLAISEVFTVTDFDNPDTDASTRSLAWTTSLFIQPIERLTLDASLTYEDLNHSSDTFIPINGILTPVEFSNDSEAVSYSVSGQFDITKNLQAKAYASWTRVYGEGASSYLHPGGELSYFWEKLALRFTTRYERPYVIERDPPHDRFYAHVVTFILTKEF